MNLQEYMQLAPRTYTGDKLEILTLGFIGEPGEMADLLKKESRGKVIEREQWLEEVGDMYWYPVVWCHVHNQDFLEINRKALKRLPDDFTLRTRVRNMAYHGTIIDECDEMGYGNYYVALRHLESYLSYLETVRISLGFTLEEIFDFNIVKLSKRYAHLLEKSAE